MFGVGDFAEPKACEPGLMLLRVAEGHKPYHCVRPSKVGALGATISPSGDITYPWYCGTFPYAVGATIMGQDPACNPPTPDQIRAAQKGEFGPALSPQSVQDALKAGDASVAAYCAAHPDECTAYKSAASCPSIVATFGETAAELLGCPAQVADITGNCPVGYSWDGEQCNPVTGTNWLLIAGLIVAGAFLLGRVV